MIAKVCDDTNNIKDLFYLNMWPHNAKHLMNKKENMWISPHVVPTKPMGYHDLLITQTIIKKCNSFFKIEMITSSTNTNLLKEKIILFDCHWLCWFFSRV